MVFGVGIDLQEIGDFRRSMERAGQPYIERIFTSSEIAYCRAKPDSFASFAVRFAAKEATIKALGIAGVDGLKWHDFEIKISPAGSPSMSLSGVAAQQAAEKQVASLVVSLTHSSSTAAAVVIAEGATLFHEANSA